MSFRPDPRYWRPAPDCINSKGEPYMWIRTKTPYPPKSSEEEAKNAEFLRGFKERLDAIYRESEERQAKFTKGW